MVITTQTGRNIKLSWIHSSHNFETRDNAGPTRLELDATAGVLGRRLTVCQVSELGYSGSNDEPTTVSRTLLGEGLAICHPHDPFKKSVGRKLALTYALAAASSPEVYQLNLQERRDIWGAYLGRFGNH